MQDVRERLETLVGDEIGVSDWFPVDQDRIDAFADATEDHQWIHVDAERAAEGPFGTTIAHGFLTLSLTVALAGEVVLDVGQPSMSINYGLDKVRFTGPVPSGTRVRARVTLAEVTEKGDALQVKRVVTVEREDEERPALVAETIALYYYRT